MSFVRKPPGRGLEDIARVIRCERQCPNLRLMYGFNHRYHDSVQDALKIVRSGELGRIINLRGVYGKSKLVTFNQSDWRTKREVAGGGVLLDQGIHMVDLFLYLGGDFDSIHATVSNLYWKLDVEDNVFATLENTKTKITASLHSTMTQWRHLFSLEVLNPLF